jgi:hypothetical protein
MLTLRDVELISRIATSLRSDWLKDVEKNGSERCLVNRVDIRRAAAERFARESRREPCSGGA